MRPLCDMPAGSGLPEEQKQWQWMDAQRDYSIAWEKDSQG